MIRVYRHTILAIPDGNGCKDFVRVDYYAGRFTVSADSPCSFVREHSLPNESVTKSWLVGWLSRLPNGTESYEGA